MSSIEPAGGRRPSRRSREQRAFRLVQASSGLTFAAVVALVLGAVGVIGYGPFVVLTLAAVACWVLLRRSFGGR